MIAQFLKMEKNNDYLIKFIDLESAFNYKASHHLTVNIILRIPDNLAKKIRYS
jgi:hypothetical protein